ncbi:ubiquinol-cytochrome c reductase iron-sulfur subunit [Cellulomonas sp. URHD0024]|uniref:QcrA and Rieske domain-containing protein n=1 Tax=Cellulomonas sp. URHD0024 TaxID=1302620 RepID=UPI00040D7D59|nr:Rieske (2Fe-2S) protein [Cellulomonas sp. URHD0024]
MSSLLDSPNTLDPTDVTHADCTGCLDRRTVLARAGLVTMGVAAAGVLAACGGSSSNTDPGSTSGGGGSGGDGSLAKVSDIPEGGAISATGSDGKPILLTQPSAGTIVALTAICTHQGCTVAPDGKQLKCPCHGSVYDLSGKNVSGPAPAPLTAIDVHVSNGEVLAGKA